MSGGVLRDGTTSRDEVGNNVGVYDNPADLTPRNLDGDALLPEVEQERQTGIG